MYLMSARRSSLSLLEPSVHLITHPLLPALAPSRSEPHSGNDYRGASASHGCEIQPRWSTAISKIKTISMKRPSSITAEAHLGNFFWMAQRFQRESKCELVKHRMPHALRGARRATCPVFW